MVATEVEEGGHVEDDAGDPAHHQRVAGDLHRAGRRRPARPSPRTARAGRAPRAWSARSSTSWPAIRVPTVPITAGGHAGGGQAALEQPGGGGLALGAGDGHQGQGARRARRTAARRGGRARERGSSSTSSGTPVVPERSPAPSGVGEHRDGAGGDRVGGVRRPVGPAAGQGGVEVTGADPLGAQREPGDLERRPAVAGRQLGAGPGARPAPSGVRGGRAGRVRFSSGTGSRLSHPSARRRGPTWWAAWTAGCRSARTAYFWST